MHLVKSVSIKEEIDKFREFEFLWRDDTHTAYITFINMLGVLYYYIFILFFYKSNIIIY